MIAPPEIEITAGEEEGDVEFDAVVEVRPVSSSPATTGCGRARLHAGRRRGGRPPDRHAPRPLRRPRGLTTRSSTAATPRSTSSGYVDGEPVDGSPRPTCCTRWARGASCPRSTTSSGRRPGESRVHRRAARAVRRAGRRRSLVPGAGEGREAQGAPRAHRRVGRARSPTPRPSTRCATRAGAASTSRQAAGADGVRDQVLDELGLVDRSSRPTRWWSQEMERRLARSRASARGARASRSRSTWPPPVRTRARSSTRARRRRPRRCLPISRCAPSSRRRRSRRPTPNSTRRSTGSPSVRARSRPKYAGILNEEGSS